MVTQTDLFVWTLIAAGLAGVVLLAGTTISGLILRKLKKLGKKAETR